MSEGPGLKQAVADEVSDQVGVSGLVGDGSIEDELDGGEIGAAVGRQFGERAGRELGTSIGRELHETFSQALETDDEIDLRSEVGAAVRSGVSAIFEDGSVSDSLQSLVEVVTEETDLEEVLEGDEKASERAVDAEGEDEIEDGEGEADAEGEEQADESRVEDEADSPAPGDLEDLRRDTLEDFLGVMSYQDLQSVAKDVGVKANLSREEMTERIIETVTESEGDESDEEEQTADAG
ncbi:hypothetical protein [Natronobacterium gregoryi]|uniref:Uncharacterized protein n=2 Tax=Natronobacterium gregoryi TaxID=44930 RepID=L0AF78_NATGS|nr:hypothetical protein [Natronobacterium gregoryi]AFZ71787.1 hypothetical protein Natgr_0534 [Natronobacterium gregoryi SP2]ELY72828.1 hypothetical protein C490_02366 [Natronobacterium gregoryi SP2]PLK21033.1 hypothetical protein CYV19_06265 [Natronobacterium gregoryi SP2]SFI87825.1 hypothetical protein SAMN05443661_10836 [Natronobacterium gregoryi]